uniref:LRRNT domain-containing protein n=2 Tax=Ciona intestinalis TaxID=7719 RepID=F6RLL0_CIOIN
MEHLFVYLLLVLLVSTERSRGSLRWRYDDERCYQSCKCIGTGMKCNVTLYPNLYEPGPTACFEALSFRFYRVNIRCLIKFTITSVPDLRSLDLSGNRMSHFPNTVLQNLPPLQHLNLSRNRLNFFQWGLLPKSIHLKSLDLSNNHLTSLVLLQAQHSFPNLERLYLSNNRLITIMRMSLTLPKLRELNLRNTSLHAINPGVFDSFSNLQKLDLGQNHLKTIPASLFSLLKNLRDLRLNHNLLQRPDLSWFTHMIQNNFSTTVDLQYNPWICDTSIYSFWNFVKELSTDDKNRTLANDLNLVCENPINEKGKTLTCLSFADLE